MNRVNKSFIDGEKIIKIQNFIIEKTIIYFQHIQ